ncbi:hypothetical protein AB0O11_38315, partial [Kitasatospora sp. NPDC093102]
MGDVLSGMVNLGGSGKQTPSWWAWLMGAISGSSYPKADPAGLLAGAGALRRAAGFVNDRVLAVERAVAGAGVAMPGAGAMMASTLVGVGDSARDGARTLDEGATALEEQAREVDRAQLMLGFTAAITLWTVAQLAWAIAATGGTSAALVPAVMAGGRRSVSEIVAELLGAMRSGALFGAGQDALVQAIEAAKYRQGLDATSLLISAVGGLAGGIGDVAGRGLGDRLAGPDLLRKTAGGALGGAIGGEAGMVISTAWQNGPWDPTAFALAAAAGAGTGAIGGATHHYQQTRHHSASPPHATPETPAPHTGKTPAQGPHPDRPEKTPTPTSTQDQGQGPGQGRGQGQGPARGHQAGEPAPEPAPVPDPTPQRVAGPAVAHGPQSLSPDPVDAHRPGGVSHEVVVTQPADTGGAHDRADRQELRIPTAGSGHPTDTGAGAVAGHARPGRDQLPPHRAPGSVPVADPVGVSVGVSRGVVSESAVSVVPHPGVVSDARVGHDGGGPVVEGSSVSLHVPVGGFGVGVFRDEGGVAAAGTVADRPARPAHGGLPASGVGVGVGQGVGGGVGGGVLSDGVVRVGGGLYERGDWRSGEPHWPWAVAKAQGHPLVREVQGVDRVDLVGWWRGLSRVHRQWLRVELNMIVAPEGRPAPAAEVPEPVEVVALRAAFAGELAVRRLMGEDVSAGELVRAGRFLPAGHPVTTVFGVTATAIAGGGGGVSGTVHGGGGVGGGVVGVFRDAAGRQATAADRRRFVLPAGARTKGDELRKQRGGGGPTGVGGTVGDGAGAGVAPGVGDGRGGRDGGGGTGAPGRGRGKRPVPGSAGVSPAGSTVTFRPKRSRTALGDSARAGDLPGTGGVGGVGGGSPVVDGRVEAALVVLAGELKEHGVRALRGGSLGELARYVLPVGAGVEGLRRAAGTALGMDAGAGLSVERLVFAHGVNVVLDACPGAVWRERVMSYAGFLEEHLLPADEEHFEALHRLYELAPDHGDTGAGVRGRIDALLTVTGAGGQSPGAARRWGLLTDAVAMCREDRVLSVEALAGRGEELLPGRGEELLPGRAGEDPVGGVGEDPVGGVGSPGAGSFGGEARAEAVAFAVGVAQERGLSRGGVPSESDAVVADLAERYLDALAAMEAVPPKFRPADIHALARNAVTAHADQITTAPAHTTDTPAGDAGRPADEIAAAPVGGGLPAGGEAGGVTRFHRRIPDHPFTVRSAPTKINCHGLSITIPLSRRGSFGEQDLTGVLRHTDGVWRVRFTTPDGGEFFDHVLPSATSGTCKPGDETVLGLTMTVPARPKGAGAEFRWSVKLKGLDYQKTVVFSHPDHRSVSKPYDEPPWAH